MLRRFLLRLSLGFGCALVPSAVFAQFAGVDDICLLEPIGGTRCFSSVMLKGPFGLFGAYFNLIYPWFMGVAAGLALLMVLTGGVNIIQSGGDQSARQNGIERMKWAIFGLLFLIFANVILQTLNPSFYK